MQLDDMPRDDAPLCECHKKPMRWNADARRRGGGGWRCNVKTIEAQTRWQQSPGGRIKHNALHRRRIARLKAECERRA